MQLLQPNAAPAASTRLSAAHLDAGNDALALEDLHEGGASVVVLVQGLLEQDLQGKEWEGVVREAT